MGMTRASWCQEVASLIGLRPGINVITYAEVIGFLVGWTVVETNPGPGARYNLLNTEQKAPGSTNFNKAGVQNFPTFLEGCETNAQLILRGYPSLAAAIKNADVSALGFPNGRPSAGVEGDLAMWVHGNRSANVSSYIRGIFANTGRGNDVINYPASTGGGGGGGSGGGGGNGGGGGSGGGAPDTTATELVSVFASIDQSMAISDPFAGLPELDNSGNPVALVISIFGWLVIIGRNIIKDAAPLVLRVMLLILAVAVLWKLLVSFVDTEGMKNEAEEIAKLAAMT